jgi:hypothetical protein
MWSSDLVRARHRGDAVDFSSKEARKSKWWTALLNAPPPRDEPPPTVTALVKAAGHAVHHLHGTERPQQQPRAASTKRCDALNLSAAGHAGYRRVGIRTASSAVTAKGFQMGVCRRPTRRRHVSMEKRRHAARRRRRRIANEIDVLESPTSGTIAFKRARPARVRDRDDCTPSTRRSTGRCRSRQHGRNRQSLCVAREATRRRSQRCHHRVEGNDVASGREAPGCRGRTD